MIRLRLQRRGRKKRPYYHVVAADQRFPRDGRVIERLGRFDNVSENKQLILDEERVIHWLKVGAQPSDTVRSLLKQEGIMYKMHLIRWGKSDEEIEAAISKWKEERSETQAKKEVSRKARQKSLLEAEEKEYQKQLEQKAAEAAKQAKIEKARAEAEKEAEAAAEAAESEAEVENEQEAKVQPETEDVLPDEEEAREESSEKTTEDVKPEAEEPGKTSEDEEAEEVKMEEAEAEEPTATAEVEEEVEEKEEKEEEKPKTESEARLSTDMKASEAIDHIKNSSLEELEGFVPKSEDRVTVQRAWESKQSE